MALGIVSKMGKSLQIGERGAKMVIYTLPKEDMLWHIRMALCEDRKPEAMCTLILWC